MRVSPFLLILSAVLLLCPARFADAEEGMFLLHEADRLPWSNLKHRGLALDAAGLQALAPAIAQLNRGGTGSFVSSEGLIVTNHHVAYGCIVQLDGSSHPGIMERGHVAASRETEIPCPGYDLLAVREIRDVSKEVLSVVRPRMKPARRLKAIVEKTRTMEAACERRGNRVCAVDALNGGAGYTLSVYQRLRDVRLVYAPSGSLGKFGGDEDNWRYPRHTGDFTFLRAYAGPDGGPATHHADNVPYKPAKWLRISTRGVRQGDASLVLGFPGRTMRHVPPSQARYHAEHRMAPMAKLLKVLLDALPGDDLGKRRYGSLNAGFNNAIKYYEDSIVQFAKFGLLARKEKEQASWIAAQTDAAKRKELEELLGRMDRIYADLAKVRDKTLLVGYLQGRFVRSLGTAVDIVRWSRLRGVPDVRREGERYRDKNLFLVHQQSDLLERVTTPQGEKALLLALLRYAEALPKEQRIATISWLQKLGERAMKGGREPRAKRPRRRGRGPTVAGRKGSSGKGAPGAARAADGAGAKGAPEASSPSGTSDPLSAAVDWIYASTALYPGDVQDAQAVERALAARRALFKASAGEIRRSKDPLVQLASRLAAEEDRMKKGPLFAHDKELEPMLRPTLVSRFIQPRYWDASFTLRLSYGSVQDYAEAATGKRWRYLSSLSRLVRKDRGKEPFFVSRALKALHARKDFGRWVDPVIRDVPVNFTTTLDTTGGNSGSPVLNGRGELVGLLFDGTPESILSDWQYLETQQRSICVDIRFALFLAEKLDRAKLLIRELGLSK